MIEQSDVAVVIPTRGNVPLEQLVEPYAAFDFAMGYVWDNSVEDDLGVYGRYAAIANTEAPVILTQDDDVILPPTTIQRLLDKYEPGKVVCNIPERFRRRYTDSGMVGFGAIFDRDLPRAAFAQIGFDGRVSPFVEDDWEDYRFRNDRGTEIAIADSAILRRTSDLVFTMLTPMIKLDLPYTELAYGRDETRMWRQPGHFEERDTMRKLCREIRDGA